MRVTRSSLCPSAESPCCAHCFCGARIWYEALKIAGMDEDLIRTVAMQQDQA